MATSLQILVFSTIQPPAYSLDAGEGPSSRPESSNSSASGSGSSSSFSSSFSSSSSLEEEEKEEEQQQERGRQLTEKSLHLMGPAADSNRKSSI